MTDDRTREELLAAIEQALDLAARKGGFHQAEYKAWVIDQMCRILAGKNYPIFFNEVDTDTFGWDVGVKP